MYTPLDGLWIYVVPREDLCLVVRATKVDLRQAFVGVAAVVQNLGDMLELGEDVVHVFVVENDGVVLGYQGKGVVVDTVTLEDKSIGIEVAHIYGDARETHEFVLVAGLGFGSGLDDKEVLEADVDRLDAGQPADVLETKVLEWYHGSRLVLDGLEECCYGCLVAV